MRSRDATPSGRNFEGDGASPTSGPRPGAGAPEDSTAVTVTAEIPVVPATAHTNAPAGYDYAPASAPARRRSGSGRLPAPYALRATVWAVAFLLLLALIGLWAVHSHPAWFTFLRNKVVASPTTPTSSLPGSSGIPTTTISPKRLGLVSSSATGATYAVPAGGYAVVLTLKGGSSCDLRIVSPAGSSTVVFESVVTPADNPKAVPLSASASVGIAAQAASIEITAGGKTVETITAPKVRPFFYHFEPVSS